MTTFLEKIVAETRAHLARRSADTNISLLRSGAEARRNPHDRFRLSTALSVKDRINIIAEIKRASPSKNVIDGSVDAAERAATYEKSGAAAISILTEPKYFRGSLDDIRDARRTVEIPLLRKDFIVDPIQIYEAADAGADAILLIVAALDEAKLRSLLGVANSLGLDALVEVHSLEEMNAAADAGASIIGINNRDLHSLAVDLATSFELAEHKPANTLLVAESGISSTDEIERLHNAGFDGFLIGEALMTSGNPAEKLLTLSAAGGTRG
ncbi:MAG: indole-3-glycerol phosphate synthase TrpC [Acidobacteria bacterium ACB1]|nr:Indole-3-glycerol phosphate synthase [Pyrinomonadaceae bacterium]MCE7962433.1 indole-3-glycerol phosphate synthase TrpC [Acidobacteria bacterium ACB1]RIJ94028.1 MAG: indole-3-glycerol phosphate synthase TrpC [Acidobacteriota bacterium]